MGSSNKLNGGLNVMTLLNKSPQSYSMSIIHLFTYFNQTLIGYSNVAIYLVVLTSLASVIKPMYVTRCQGTAFYVYVRATACHLPCGITQCYLPPDVC